MSQIAAIPLRRPALPTLVCADDSPLRDVERACQRIARSDASVLILGETGTGKEVFARLVHSLSERAGGPFVPVNCAAIPETLLEAELFGHARGAFTGAQQARTGRLAQAHKGTLLLDEVGELPLAMQAKLLRVLQERTFEPVGSSQPQAADFRLVAATNRDLAVDVAAGRFRADLYYRLLVCPLELPALRSRRADVPLLFRHFLKSRGDARELAPDLFEALSAYTWPGNVRELQNLAERLSVCATGPSFHAADLPDQYRSVVTGPQPPPANDQPARPQQPPAPQGPSPHERAARPPSLPIDLPKLLRDLEDSYIEAALAQADGNKTEAAELLGLQRTTLVEKLRRRASAKSLE